MAEVYATADFHMMRAYWPVGMSLRKSAYDNLFILFSYSGSNSTTDHPSLFQT